MQSEKISDLPCNFPDFENFTEGAIHVFDRGLAKYTNHKAINYFDAYGELIALAEKVSKLPQTPEQQLVSNETIDRLIALRGKLSPTIASRPVYGFYDGKDFPTLVRPE